ncbi:MAG: hypothetical protein ACRC6E_13195 [Fusobacteriaceae bacterium]
MRKILYLMHVDWGWIKQRPHFIAEELAENFRIVVFYSYGKDRKKMKKNQTKIPVYPFLKFPFRRKVKIIRYINEKFLKFLFYLIIKINKIDTVWITNPELYQYISSRLNIEIFYDCMDDNISIESDEKYKIYLEAAERKLLEVSSKIFITSQNLIQKILKRYDNLNLENKIYLSATRSIVKNYSILKTM